MELDLKEINEEDLNTAIDYLKADMWKQHGNESIEDKARAYATAISAMEELKLREDDLK